MARGIGFVLAEPGRYLLLSLSRVRDYFEFWPTADSSLIFNAGRVRSIRPLPAVHALRHLADLQATWPPRPPSLAR